MEKFTREQWIEKRVSEGFSEEQAGNEYDKYLDPAIKEAQAQKVPTRKDMLEMINEDINKNPNKKKLYTPNFKLSGAYTDVHKELEALKRKQPYDAQKAKGLSDKMLSIQINGSIDYDEYHKLIDESLEMPIKEIIAERKKYEKIVADCEDQIENFDLSACQSKVDALTAEYDKKLKGKIGLAVSTLKDEYNKKVDELELEMIIKPRNELAIKRWEAKQYYLIYEARVKYYVSANKDLIEEEIQQAKRDEVRESLVDLAGYLEEA